MDKSLKIDQGMTRIIGKITESRQEVIKSMEDKIIMEIDSGEILEIKAMREVGVSQMIGNLEVVTEGTIEVLAIVDQGQDLE